MSITVRLWNDTDLKAINHDKWLATLLMNTNTLTEEMSQAYPYKQVRKYLCEWVKDHNQHTILATDERMLLKFIDAEYTRRPDFIYQKITQYRPVKF